MVLLTGATGFLGSKLLAKLLENNIHQFTDEKLKNSESFANNVVIKQTDNNNEVKEKIQSALGSNFQVKTNFEKNELIFQTSKSERMVVIIIMIFIFILASFNLIASLTMLYIEKKDNISSLESFGLSRKGVFQIFFFEGTYLFYI